MSAWRTKSGFTLVEVIAAVGAFTIAFLAGFAAIGTFMIRQDMNYQRTLAASAAMFLAEWHTNKVISSAAPRPDLIGTASGSALVIAWPKGSANLSNITFKGGDKNEMNSSTDHLFVFNQTSITDATGNTIDSSAFAYGMRDLIVSMPAAASTEASNLPPVRQVSFWFGSRADVLAASASSKTTVEFLGRYLIADPIP